MNKLTKNTIVCTIVLALLALAAIYIPGALEFMAIAGFLSVLWVSLYFAKTMGDKLAKSMNAKR